MKLRLLGILALSSLISLTAQAGWWSAKAPIHEAGTFSPHGTVSIENVNGKIIVEAWDKNEYLIEGEISAKSDEDLERIELDWDLTGDHIGLKVRLPKKKGWFNWGNVQGKVELTIKVPSSATLERISSVNGGVSVTGITGDVRANTVNGGVKAYNLGGSAHLNTVNGGVSASFTHVAPSADLSFETVNGGLTVTLPRDANAELKANVVNGGIKTELPMTIQGNVSKRSLRGTVGNGGAFIKASTVNGGVVFRASS